MTLDCSTCFLNKVCKSLSQGNPLMFEGDLLQLLNRCLQINITSFVSAVIRCRWAMLPRPHKLRSMQWEYPMLEGFLLQYILLEYDFTFTYIVCKLYVQWVMWMNSRYHNLKLLVVDYCTSFCMWDAHALSFCSSASFILMEHWRFGYLKRCRFGRARQM